jgi:transcription antitermination factor NusG
MFEGRPAEIPEDEIEAVRRLVLSGLSFNPHPYLKAGRRVYVTSGPLEGCEGVLTRRKGLTRLVLSIHILQQSVIAEVDTESVEPL